MIQYILTPAADRSIPELVQGAISGGCGWIDIDFTDMPDDELRGILVPEVVELCRESGTFLTVRDRPDLAREAGLHGVSLSRGYWLKHAGETPLTMRENLGPEAVIGIETSDVSSMEMLKAADVDYVLTPPAMTASARREFVAAVRQAGFDRMPLVACGGITPENVAAVLDDGFNGVAVGRYITESEDPGDAVEQIIEAISRR